MLYQQEYPDTAMSGSVGSYGSTPQNTPQPQQWRRGYMAEAKLASWPWRLASGAIDYVPLMVIFDFFGMVHAGVLGFVIATAAGLANSVYMQGTTGQSLGKRIVGTRLVSAVETGPWTFSLRLPGHRAVLWPPSGAFRRLHGLLHRLYPAAVAARAQDLGRLDRQDRRARPLGLWLRDQGAPAGGEHDPESLRPTDHPKGRPRSRKGRVMNKRPLLGGLDGYNS